MTTSDTGTFVALRPSSSSLDDLEVLQQIVNVSTPVPRELLHCTLVDSPKTMEGFSAYGNIWPGIFTSPSHLEVWPWESDRECLVLVLHDEENITLRHSILNEVYEVPPASHPFVPHITLAYGTEKDTLRLISPSVLQSTIISINLIEEYSVNQWSGYHA